MKRAFKILIVLLPAVLLVGSCARRETVVEAGLRTPRFFIQVPIAILITFGGLTSPVSALRNCWRLSKNFGQFLGNFLRVSGVAIAIIIACQLLVFGVVR